jgi:hypothetical protein
VRLDLLDEYPRWLKKEHEINGSIKDAIPIRATFEFDDDEMQELAGWLGDGVLSNSTVSLHRSYADPDTLEVEASIDYAAYVNPFVASLPSRLHSSVGKPGTVTELRKALAALVAARNAEDEASVTLAADAEDAIKRLDESLGAGVHLRSAIDAHIRELLPRTFYFSTYSQLDGRYLLQEVFDAVGGGSEDESLRAAADFLQLARVVPEVVEDWDFEASNAELEAISSLLTKRVKEHWKQNDHLRLKVSLESQQERRPAPEADLIKRYLQFRVEHTRHDFSSRLDRRSTGFRWFISFIASFLEFEADQNLILLLDEPGLSLHARAQMDLLDTIEASLANGRQVLYSTHSPFMVKTNRLDRVRITEDQGPDLGSVVTNDAGVVSDPDTLFPLQAALGYDVVQSLFIGKQNVLVEGVSDFIYVTMISDHLGTLGRTTLTDTARLLPAGGATNIPTSIALLGGQLDLVVVLDGNSDGQRIANSISQGRPDQARVLSLDSHSSVKGADIEDLFTPSEYLGFFNGAFGKMLKAADLNGSDRIVKRIARNEGDDFNHGVVAAHFLRNLDTSIKKLSDGTLDRFERLIAEINAALPTP